jgi:hypothetical protein
LALEPRSGRPPGIIEAERRPLVTYSGGNERAWEIKVKGDVLPAPPAERRLPAMLATTAALLFLAAFFGGRHAAVAALPDLAGLYAAIGLPVNLYGLSIEDVAAERGGGQDGRVVVSGTIRNIAWREQQVPPLAAMLYDARHVPAGFHGFAPPVTSLDPGEGAPFLVELNAPNDAAEVVVRFEAEGEEWPNDSGAAEPR